MINKHVLSVTLFFLILIAFTSAIAGTVSYQYDGLNRLVRMAQLDGTVVVYTYDDVGNRTSKAVSLLDSDGDGLPDSIENSFCTDPNDADTDDDGISDGNEDTNHNGVWDTNETNPCAIDTDGDGIQDGTETGVSEPVPDPDGAGPLLGTDTAVFQPDLDPTTTTNPLLGDTDGDGLTDGMEDSNFNGKIDAGEYDPRLHAPYIAKISPQLGPPGTEISIIGTHFLNSQGSSQVIFFDQVNASDITLWSNTKIKCLVPDGAQIGCLSVKTIGGPSNCKSFGKDSHVLLPPIYYLLLDN